MILGDLMFVLIVDGCGDDGFWCVWKLRWSQWGSVAL